MTRYQVVAVLTAIGVAAGVIAGFIASAVAGFGVLCILFLGVALLLSYGAPRTEEGE